MNRIRRILSFPVALTILVLLAVPVAGARTLEPPQMAVRAEEPGWIGTAVQWLEDLFGARRPAAKDRTASRTSDRPGKAANGGPCIDPMGNPRPWCP